MRRTVSLFISGGIAVIVTSCGGSDSTSSVGTSIVINTISCSMISQDNFFRSYEVTALGSASGPVGAQLTPSGGQGTSGSDPNRSGESITDFFAQDWLGQGAANLSAAREDGDPATTTFTVSFETAQPKPVSAMTVYIDVDVFAQGNGHKSGVKTTTCQ